MNNIVLVSIFAFIFLTYKLMKVFENRGVSRKNKLIAWSLYGVGIVGLVAVNVLV